MLAGKVTALYHAGKRASLSNIDFTVNYTNNSFNVAERKKKLKQLEETLDDGADNEVTHNSEQKKKKKKKSKQPQQGSTPDTEVNGVKQREDKRDDSEETGYESEEGKGGK